MCQPRRMLVLDRAGTAREWFTSARSSAPRPRETLSSSWNFSEVSGVLVPMAELEDLYRRHVGAAMKAAWLVTNTKPDADDLVQEAFVRCASRLGGIRDLTGFGSYWQRTVVRLAANDTRRLGYERRLIGRLAAKRPPAPDEAAEVTASRMLLNAALAVLPSRQRAVLVARFYLDLSEADTAAALGMRLGTVKSASARGLAALRAAVIEEA
jgi:RNA polymerase sigma factor (sigma-70 family)